MLVAVIVILAGVVVVASGRGGEMAPEYPDYPPIDLGPVSAADVALLRPPSAAWGYNMRVTDEALETIARAVTERDIKISALQQEVSDLREEIAHDWTRQSGAPAATVVAPGAAAEAERPGEGPCSTEPVRPLDEENAAAAAQWPGPPWAQPEPIQPHTSQPQAAGPQAAGPQAAGPQAAEPEPTAPQPVVSGAARHGPAPPQEPSGNESSDEEPSYGVPGHAAAQYRACGEPNGRDSWEEPHQTLVWGAEHQRAKAGRLQEQRHAPQPQDAPSENLTDDYRPTEDAPSAGAPTADWPGQDAPHQDAPTADAATADWPDEHAPHQHAPGAPASGQDGPTEDARGQDSPGPASAGHWAEVTAPSHYEDARHPAQAEQDRE